ncbi:KilA-N domain-containing protein [Vibrio ouci]|uniref:KilA-N domain-containing protein n=1 Tax=Vibrio ouci TaxID=2499078 RepID=UPI0034E095E5
MNEIEQSRNSCFGENSQSANSHFALNTKRGGCNSGTWACKELVYSYAMWISPKFHLNVIRAFDSMSTNQTLPLSSPIPPSDLSLNDLIYELAKAKNITTQNIHIHYNSIFNTNVW